MSKEYLTRRKLCERYAISAMTLWRWEHDDPMGFPAPMLINRRKLYARDEIERWERARVAPSRSCEHMLMLAAARNTHKLSGGSQ